MQPPSRRCPTCGTAVSADQRFCANCGASLDQDVSNPTVFFGEQKTTGQPASSPPPPPDIDQYSTYRQQMNYPVPPPPGASGTPGYTPNMSEATAYPSYAAPTQGQTTPPYAAPAFTSPPPDNTANTNRILKRIGCGALFLIALGLALCGALGYGGYTLVSQSIAHTAATATATAYREGSTSTTSNDQSSNAGTPAAQTVKTVPLNLTVKYSTIDYTILDVKQGNSFAGDSSSANGVIRVDLKEVNATNHSVIFGYYDKIRLILPDQNSVPPQSYKNVSPPSNGASQDNWLDFPAPVTTPIDKLTLRFGAATEAQMDVPLTPGANLTKYQDVTAKPNKYTTYSGLRWTLTSTTRSWSAYNRQAENGKRYVTIDVSVDNPTDRVAIGYVGDYLRLKAGSLTSTPESDTTIPTSFAAGSSGATGSASFLVPEGSTSFTLILLADKLQTGAPQATLDFTIP